MSRSVMGYFLKMIQIDSESGDERQMADYLKRELAALGGEVREDDAGLITGGNAGNVIAWFAGDAEIEPLLLNAHMDTVIPGKGITPVIGEKRITSDGRTILGADDKSGIAWILAILNERHKLASGRVPLEVVFTISEETGLRGAKALNVESLHSRRGYSLDGNILGDLVSASPSQINYTVTFTGKSVHAGVEPEKGINAIMVVAEFLKNLPDGRIDEKTTMNAGRIRGGKATNIVCDEVILEGEIRSHDEKKLKSLLELAKGTAEVIAQKWRAGVEFHWESSFKALRFEEGEELLEISKEAFGRIGLQQNLKINGGGSDANALAEKGVRLAVVGTGMQQIHTVNEYIEIEDLQRGMDWLRKVIEIWGERCRN